MKNLGLEKLLKNGHLQAKLSYINSVYRTKYS